VTSPGDEPVISPGGEPVISPGGEPVTSPGGEPVTSPGGEPVTSPADESVIRLRYDQAVNAALARALAEFPETIFFGEDVAVPGGVFGASRGLHDRFGPRVFDTPISEAAIIGAALGAALVGRRPIVEIMWADFLFVGVDQLINQAAHVRYLSRGQLQAPLTVRTQQGAVASSSIQHSRCIEAFLAHVPGLKVALPSCAADAYAVLLAAIKDDDPVVVIEHRGLYPHAGAVALDGPIEPVGGARIRRSGGDVTVVALSRMVEVAMAAAEPLAALGIDCEIIDPRWINPFDCGAVMRSLERTSRLVIVHEAARTAGFGAEIAARAAEEWFWLLDAPVVRVTAPDVPKPSAPTLEAAVIPSPQDVVDAVRRLIEI
jgi:acetoin:2,6-dichlorophenolindophenol oxidoreductase subunit beta